MARYKREFQVKKILQLNFEELVRVKPADGGDREVRSVKMAWTWESVTSREVHIVQCDWNVWEVAENDTENISEKGHWITLKGSGEQLDGISWGRI